MSPEQITQIAQQSIITLLYVCGPLMFIALLVGLIISLFQALTSIQEMTLTFVPKILIVFIALIFLMPFMADQMNGMAQDVFANISASGSNTELLNEG